MNNAIQSASIHPQCIYIYEPGRPLDRIEMRSPSLKCATQSALTQDHIGTEQTILFVRNVPECAGIYISSKLFSKHTTKTSDFTKGRNVQRISLWDFGRERALCVE